MVLVDALRSFGGILTGASSRAASEPGRCVDGQRPADPMVTTSSAPTVGPRTVSPLRVSDSSALAG